VTISENDRIREIVHAIKIIMRMQKAQPGFRKSEEAYYRMLSNYFNRILEAAGKGDFIAAHTVFFPAEIIYAMGLVPMHTESTTWTISLFTGKCDDMVSKGIELGMASEICTPHRGLAGAYALGALPKPSVMVWSNMVCDNTAKSGELIMDMFDIPGFFLDRPFKDSRNEIEYFAGELQDMITFLEEQSGKKMDWKKLGETVAHLDKEIQLIREINELRKHVPTPFSPLGFLQLLTVDYLFPGQPESIEYLELLLEELHQAIKEGKGAVPKEQFRLMTLFLPPIYLMSFLDKISQKHGAVSVVEPFFTFWGEGRLDPTKPLESIARKSYMIPEARMYGPMDDRAINSIKQCAKEYKVDGAIYYADVGCRHSCATIKLFKDILNDMDIPVLTIDCDVVDETSITPGELGEKLDGFFELLEDR
jgi:benzoyl-CoA reductase/2-hydroxyglutaryl-CoA dehydratase subunit BcrC/BadD/HgdB